jgi:predicted Rossmann-fold nucleotide-binding protein
VGRRRAGPSVVRAAQAVIAIAGEFDTLSEIAFALKIGKPVIGLSTWQLARSGQPVEAIVVAGDPADAVRKALALASGSRAT